MNRTILALAGVLSASSLLLVDSAVKGTVLLALAAVAALILRRDSAATRHLVWLLAIVTMLVVPVLSALLPRWRVLPAWASHSAKPVVVDASPPSIVRPAEVVVELPQASVRPEVERSISMVDQPAAEPSVSRVAIAAPPFISESMEWSWNWSIALPLIWAIGFCVLVLRLTAARWMLWNSERRATVVCCRRVAPQLAFELRSDSATANDPIVMAMETICSQLGISRPVTLLIHPDKTIPVVWGILHWRLMLPTAARQWSDEQLRSVLLHELAHVKRRDTLVQLLTQVACVLHWFNPLVWFAAWRLDVERERSCDDLVLASGVRPSAYAGHLLDVVTGLAPARWTQACGLAMARKSSLEGRLKAVLGKDLNRRGVSVALAGLALAIAVGIAVPIAMLRAADEKWNSPQAAHIGTNDFSAYCVHDGKDAAFVIAYHGDFGSATESSSNAKTRSWTDTGTITAKKPRIALSFHRTHTAPGKLSITIAPAEGRDLSKPAPPPRKLGQKEYDLAKGRVFVLGDDGSVRQLDIESPVVTDQESAKKLAALIAAIPPQEREDVEPTTNRTGKLAPETVAKLKWGEPVNGLRMALAWPPSLDEPALGKKPRFELVVQNVTEKELHFLACDEAPNPQRILIRQGERIELVLRDHLNVSPADWKLRPGECGVLRMFATEESNKAGTVPSSAIESDLSQLGRYHAIAEMEIVKAPPGAWTGKLVTGPTRGSADVAAAPAPMHKDARALYEIWQRYARANGDIPGALIGELAGSVKQFIKYNPTWETVPKLNQLLPRLDATHDWKSADAIALLDEVAGIKDSPLSMAMRRGTRHTIRKGDALPKKFADAPWGEAQSNGLRAAWVLEPGAAEHRIGAALKARLLVQNSGQVAVMLRVPTFHQGGVYATDAKGVEVQVSGIEWTTMAQLVPVRLGPGEFIEIHTPGIGFGPRAGMGPWAGPRVGSNVLAKAGDELTLTHSPVPLDGSEVGMSDDDPHVIGPGWWQAHIKARLARELPLPADDTERTRLLDRAVRELFATAPTAEETAAFVADTTPDAFDALARRLAARADVVSFSGKLATAPAKFRVLAADANADKQPRVALGPGEYPLPSTSARRGDATLKIVGRPVGYRHTNDTQLLFEPVEFTGKLPPEPHKLEVPDGWGTWAIVCRPSDGFLYLLHQGSVRKIDYSDPAKVTDTPANGLPAEFRDEVQRQLDIHEFSAAEQETLLSMEAPHADSPAKDPRTAKAPGRYELGDDAYLQITQTNINPYRVGSRPFMQNKAVIAFLSSDPKPYEIELPKPYEIALPNGKGTYGIVWERGVGVLWIIEKGLVRKYDFTNPWKVQETRFAEGGIINIPERLRDSLTKAFDVAGGSVQHQEKQAFTAWGEEVNGVQIGARLGEQRVYEVGESATLILRLRNNGKVQVPYRNGDEYFLKNPPLITDASGKAVTIKAMSVFGFAQLRSVAPGKEVDLVQLKLDLQPATDRSNDAAWTIYGTGKFQIQYPVTDVVGEVGPDLPGMKLTTGKVELEVKLPPEKEAPTVPSSAAAVPAKPKPNYVSVVGQLLDDETGQPIEKAGWEWGMADPKKPDQISWGHSSVGGSHPGGKFEMPLNISADGHHYPLRVYSAGYETTVVVDELAKPYPDKIERIVRLKRGRSITGVLRDHTGKPVANGWVFFIPKGHRTNIVEGISGTDAHQLPVDARDGAVAEVRTNENGTFALSTGVDGTLAASTDLVDLWPFPLPVDGYAELKMPTPSYLVIDLSYWYLDELVKNGKRALSSNSEDPNQCWIQVDQSGSTEPLWNNLGYRRQMLVFAKDPRVKLAKGVIVGHVVEGEMDKPIPDVGHNKNLSTKIRIALPPGSYRVQRLRAGPFAPVDEQNVVLKPGEDTNVSWARGDGSSVRGKATWPTNLIFVRQPGELPRKLDWTVPDTASVLIVPVGADGTTGPPIEAAKIQADGSFFIATNLDPGKYKATATVYLPESDDSMRRDRERGPDCEFSQEFTVPDPARGPFGSPPVDVEIKMAVGANGRFVPADVPPAADPPKAAQPPAEKEQEPFTAWGKEVGGLQAGLGFKTGGKRAFRHGEKVTLVVRVRNVGKQEAKFDYIPEHFIENPPTVLDEEARAVPLARGLVDTGVQIGREATLAPGKEIELAELTLEFSSQNDADADFRKELTIYGTGKFRLGFENVLGTGFIKPDSALSTLATGNLELEIKPVAPEQQEASKPKQGATLERARLEGTWAGEKDGVKVDLNFRWKSEHQQVGWKLQTPDAGIAAQMSVIMEPDGSAAKFVFRKGLEFEATLGRLTPGEGGSLRLELIPNPNPNATKYPAVKDLVLTRQPNVQDADKPKQGDVHDHDHTEKPVSWIPARPLKTTVSKGSAIIHADHSVGLSGDVTWQDPTCNFAFNGSTTLDELRLELLAVTSPAGPRFGRGGEKLILSEVTARLEKQTGESTIHEFSSCVSLQNPDDDTTIHCIDFLSDTGWTVPALPADAEAHTLVLRFDEPVTLQPGERLVLSVDSGGSKELAVLNRIRFAFHQAATETGTVVLHAIDADTGEPIRDVEFGKESLVGEDWAIRVGSSDADGTVRIETKPLPGYFFSILHVPQGYKVSSLDEVPAHVEVGRRSEYRFHLRKLGTNLEFVNKVPAKAAENRFAEALKDTNQKSFRIVVDDMPGFRGESLTFSFAQDEAPLAERIFANGELVRSAVHDELRYFQKAEGKLAGKISELDGIQVVISSSALPRAPATSWYLHFRTKDGIELKQDGFRIRFENLDRWDLEIPAFLHPEF